MIKIIRYISISALSLSLFASSSLVVAQTNSENFDKKNSSVSSAVVSSVSTPITDSKYHIREAFVVPVLLSSPETAINAFSISVEYPENLEFVGTDEGDSIVKMWVEKPQIEDGKIIFSGIIPLGFTEILNPLNKQKSPGLVTKLIFKGKNEGFGQITATPELYSNDGKGTLIESIGFSTKITIDDIVLVKEYQWNDTTLPEQFAPVIEQDKSLFDGKYFLIFDAIDKDSGIDHYEVREGGGKWKRAQSPYLLEDQGLSSDIYVRAIDKAGNIRTAKVLAQNNQYKKPVTIPQVFLTLLIAITIIYLLRRRYRKFK